jgi:hypothetical protein
MIKFEDERDERAWVLFAAGYRREVYNYDNANSSSNDDPKHAAEFADKMVEELRKRRAHPVGGPFREEAR